MPQFNPIQTNFTAGEVSQRMKGRVDVARYANALQQCRNFIGQAQGGIYRRSGTLFTNPVKTQSLYTRIYEFKFSTLQNYVIEFGNLYCRFYKDGGQILNTALAITGATNASPIVITSNAHGYSNGQEVVVTGVGGNTAANGRWIVANVTANTYELTGSTGNGVYTAGGFGATVYEIVTTYLTADLSTLFFTQSADTLYITHPSYPPRKLTRSGHTSWTITTIDFQDGPYLSENVTATTFTAAATTGTGIALVASSIVGINGGTGFQTTDVGRLIRIRDGSTFGWAKIASRVDTTNITIDIIVAVVASARTTWRLGAWSGTTGYPSCCTFHQQRLTFANSTSQPQTVWMSVTGDYENFAPTDATTAVKDDSAVTYTIASNKVNPIFWLESGAVLLIGTADQEWQVKAGSISQPITPTNIDVTPQTSYGSKKIRATRIGTAVVFIQRSGRKVRELVYNFQVDGFQAKDMSLLAEHIIREGGYVVDVAYQQEPDSMYWVVRNDGYLAGMLYLAEQEIVGWNLQQLGGSFNSSNAVVESIAVIPTVDGTSDQLWLIVKRTINGSTKRYVEYMDVPFNPTSSTDKDSMYFVDCGLTYSGSPAIVFSGLEHLEGQTVQIIADGAVRPEAVVTAGAITLAQSASKVKIGLGYRSLMKTLPQEGGAAQGSAQGKIKRIDVISIRLLNTLGMKYGVTESNLKDYPFRKMGDKMDSSAPLFSGDVSIELNDDYNTQGTFVIVQDDPMPMNILALMPETVVYK